MARDPRGDYLTPYRKGMTAMFEHAELTHLDKAVAGWLVFAVDPGTRRLEGVTLTSLADLHRTGRKQMAASLDRLRDVGVLDYEFQRRTTGWVELCGFDQLMHWTPFLAKQRQRAYANAQPNRVGATRQRPVNASERRDSPGETSRPFLTLIGDQATA